MSVARRTPEHIRRVEEGSMGFWVSPRMRQLADTPGYLSGKPARELRGMFAQEMMRWKPKYASVLGMLCTTGDLEKIRMLVQSNPDLLDPHGSESDLNMGYLSQVIHGAKHSCRQLFGGGGQHKELLQYLINIGCPVDHVDIVGFTAFYHSVLGTLQPDLARILLDNGANVNHRGKTGTTPILDAMTMGNSAGVQFLLENGADLELSDANGDSAESLYRAFSPQVIAVIESWKRKRAGVEAPLQGKTCDSCKQEKKKVQSCGRCRLTQYCSKDCQKAHWKVHKETCFASQVQKVIVVKPHYEPFYRVTDSPYETAEFTRVSRPEKRKTSGTNMVLRVQLEENCAIIAYDRHKTFICKIRLEDNHERYMELVAVVGKKGVPPASGQHGFKAYFLADLKNPKELVIKVDNVLAEQPF